MSGDCLCVHALRCNINSRAAVLTQAAQNHSPKPTPAICATRVLTSANVHCSASTAAVASGSFSGTPTTKRPLAASLFSQANSAVTDPVIVQHLFAGIAPVSSLSATASAVFATDISLYAFTDSPDSSADVSRNLVCALLIHPGGDVTPGFQYLMQPETTTALPPDKYGASKEVGLKAELHITPGLGGVVGFHHEIEAEIVCEPELMCDNIVAGVLRAHIACEATLKGRAPQTQSFTARPSMASSLWQPRPSATVTHASKSIIRGRATTTAAMLGPGGKMTRITKKKKLRIDPKRHPESTPENTRYFWQLTVTDEDSCGCEFIRVGMYDLRDGIWKPGEERDVMLLTVDVFYGPFGPEPVLYPQYQEDGNYRIVTVKNLMHDIYPPATFIRTEPVLDELVDRQFIATELPRLVFVHEGCGGSFFLISAECE